MEQNQIEAGMQRVVPAGDIFFIDRVTLIFHSIRNGGIGLSILRMSGKATKWQ
jgi:hypothetical protein